MMRNKILNVVLVCLLILCGCHINIYNHDCENNKHVFSSWIITKESTCFDYGMRYRYCIYCGIIDGEDIEPIEHQVEWIIVKEHTPLSAGLNQCICSICGEVLEEQVIEHQFENEKCILCGIKENKNCQHTFGNWVYIKEPNCTDAGIRCRYCSNCNYSEREIVEPLGHIVGDVNVTKEPTCQFEGIEITKCARCNYVMHTEYIPIIDHIPSEEWTTDSYPTCYSIGYKHKICELCGMQMYINTQIPKTEHVASDWVVDEEPQCLEDGSKHKECIYCHKTMQTATIKTSGHNYGDWTIDKYPSCTKAGSKHRVCSACEYIDQTSISATGHSYENYVCTSCFNSIYDPQWSQGLTYRDGMITGIGTCTDANIFLPTYQPNGIEITSIRYKSFMYEKLNKTTIVVPETYVMIGPESFEGVKLNALVLSSTKTKFGRYALKDAHITTIVYPGTMQQWRNFIEVELFNNYVVQGFYGIVSCKDGSLVYTNGTCK